MLLYGAYGYTGELIAEEAADRGVDLVVAGRNGTKTRRVGIQLDVESRVFDATAAGDNLDGIDTVLNCAGPFSETSGPVVDACLETGTHYLDITGELPVFEALAERDREAEQAGVCLLPGVGFDVVPTDCVAGHLHDRLRGATDLSLGFETPGTVSGGTLVTALEQAAGGGTVRREGRLESVDIGAGNREVDFGNGPRHAVRIPWGDVSTAYYTTGVRNIEVYTAMPEQTARWLSLLQPLSPLLEQDAVKTALQWLARQFVSGPDESERESARTFVWGQASDGERTITSRLVTPETYALTVDAAATVVERIEDGDAPVGYQTPTTAFDPEFVLELDGVEGFFDDVLPEET